ncbi:MAG: hypothetical protein ABEJ44_02970 [Halanaeroarchaeum sp.]
MGIFDRGSTTDPQFGRYDEFEPEYIPAPGTVLEAHDVLDGTDHVAVHQTARDLFEARGVYDSTFGYNLAKLNLDRRHPDAGFRYAVAESAMLIAEFTPTTEFCPQSAVLTKAAHRAWNGMADEHEFDRVEIRIAEMHQNSASINADLADASLPE